MYTLSDPFVLHVDSDIIFCVRGPAASDKLNRLSEYFPELTPLNDLPYFSEGAGQGAMEQGHSTQ